MITFDTNRLGGVSQRRFNVAWREIGGERTTLLPRVAYELMGHRIQVDDLEGGVQAVQEELLRRGNRLRPKQKLWGQSVLWWASELLREDSPYVALTLSNEQQDKADEICEQVDRRAFLRLRIGDRLSDHADAVMVSEALATNTKILITNDTGIHDGLITQWALDNADRFAFETPFILVQQDRFFLEEYVHEADFVSLFKIILGASWPEDTHASIETVVRHFDRYIEVLAERETGLRGTAAVIREYWRDDGRKDDLIEHMREHLPERLRASEARHPAKRA